MRSDALPKAAGVLPLKLKDEAYLVLERMIVNGELAPGEWVSEADLVARTGFGRASIRSAIERLSDQQLMQVLPRRGAQICPVDFTQQFRCLELRRVMERCLAGFAALRASDVQRRSFAELATRWQDAIKSPDQAVMTEIDFEMSQLILTAANNPFATRAMMSVKGLSRRFWVLHQAQHGEPAIIAACYADVARAIAAGKREDSEQAVDELIDYVERFTLKVVGFSG